MSSWESDVPNYVKGWMKQRYPLATTGNMDQFIGLRKVLI